MQVIDQGPFGTIDLKLVETMPASLTPPGILAQIEGGNRPLLDTHTIGEFRNEGGKIFDVGNYRWTAVASSPQRHKITGCAYDARNWTNHVMAEVDAVRAHVANFAGPGQFAVLAPAQISLRHIHQTSYTYVTRHTNRTRSD